MKYDNENIFAKILKDEISCDKVFEDENVLSFKDINLKQNFIFNYSKKVYDIADFIENADEGYQSSFWFQ